MSSQPLSDFTLLCPECRLARRIEAGDTSALARIIGSNEIVLVAASINSMLDRIVHLLRATQSKRDELQKQVEQLIHEVSGVGEGSLWIREIVSDFWSLS